MPKHQTKGFSEKHPTCFKTAFELLPRPSLSPSPPHHGRSGGGQHGHPRTQRAQCRALSRTFAASAPPCRLGGSQDTSRAVHGRRKGSVAGRGQQSPEVPSPVQRMRVRAGPARVSPWPPGRSCCARSCWAAQPEAGWVSSTGRGFVSLLPRCPCPHPMGLPRGRDGSRTTL